MANPEHVEILKQGAKVWNEWREKNPEVRPKLSGVRISGNLPDIGSNPIFYPFDIYGLSNMELINFHQADLSDSVFDFVDFSNANFRGSSMRAAKFFGCSLPSADLSKSILLFAEIHSCDLFKTDFSMCMWGFSIFAKVDLSNAKGLELAAHKGPSSLAIDTIFQSKGRIPEPFLHGCGVPEDFIKLIPSLTAQAFDFYTCFISHSKVDIEFCNRLRADLRNGGVRVWYFPEDARTGRGVWDEIDRSIKIYDKLMVVCSENSLQSGPVLREINRALQREDREGKRILFPIAIDNYIFDEWEHPRKADVLDTVVFRKFMNWKDHDSYQKAFDRLMRDLKASEE